MASTISRRFSVLLITLVTVCSAEADLSCPSTVSCCSDIYSEVSETQDTKYGEALNLDSELESLYLDIYKPVRPDTETDPLPVMICVHGGGFSIDSSKRNGNTRGECQGWARRGFLAISIEYRRHQEAAVNHPDKRARVFTDPVEDLKAAIRYVRSQAGEWNADQSRIAVSGMSAGALTVAHCVILDLPEGSSGNLGSSSDVQMAISQSGGLRPEWRQIASTKSSAQIPRYFALHNEQDPTVDYSQSTETKQVLDDLGAANILLSLPGVDHTPELFQAGSGKSNDLLFDDLVGFAIRNMNLKHCPYEQAEYDSTGSEIVSDGMSSSPTMFLSVVLATAAVFAVLLRT